MTELALFENSRALEFCRDWGGRKPAKNGRKPATAGMENLQRDRGYLLAVIAEAGPPIGRYPGVGFVGKHAYPSPATRWPPARQISAAAGALTSASHTSTSL